MVNESSSMSWHSFVPGMAPRLLFVTAFWMYSIIPLFAIYAFGPKILGALERDEI